MIYILEASILDDLGDNMIRVYGIKYTKRRSSYLEKSSIYKVVKLLKGRGFNEKVKDRLLSTLGVFKGSNFSYRSNYIKINSITKSIIDNINTISDITNLTDIVGFLDFQEIVKSYKHHLHKLNIFYINHVELLDHNWDLIRTVYHKSGRDLIKEMLATKETDLSKYMLDTYGIELVDLPKVSPKVDKEFIRRFLQIEDSNNHLEEEHIRVYHISRLLRCCTRIDSCKSNG